MRPVQLIPVKDAHEGTTARNVPQHDEVECAGCPQEGICREREGTVFSVDEVVGSNPLPCRLIDGDLVACKATHYPELEPDDTPTTRGDQDALILLVDASVFINAERWQWEACQRVLEHAGTRYHLATTERVHAELQHSYQLPASLHVTPAGDLHPELVDVAEANAAPDDPNKTASVPDLSLVQALLENPLYAGILTEDRDLERLHVPSLVRELAGRDVSVWSCEGFVRAHRGWFG